MTARRIGLFGGTFDPPHEAHLALARSARDALALDEVRWIPAGAPWQKTRAITPAVHREAMVRLAIDGEPRFVLDRSELERDGPSYTVDTVRALAREQPNAQLFLILGADQYAGLPTWHRVDELLQLVTLAVAARPGAPALPPSVVPLPMALHDLSATAIRARAAHGLPLGALVAPAVERYIESNALYRS